MSLFGGIANTILRGLLNTNDPNSVQKVQVQNYTTQLVHRREDSLVLYGPTQQQYEILVHVPCSSSLSVAYSLLRTKELLEAETQFLSFKDKLPLLVEINAELCNESMLQKICDTIKVHPSWTAAHLVAFFNLPECLKHNLISSQVNQQDPESGATPLHIAVQKKNVRMVNALLEVEASVDFVDAEMNSVFHLAAETSKDIIEAVTAKPSSLLNECNSANLTPLHIACYNDKPDCVKALLCAGADVNILGSQGSVYPIHSAVEASSTQCAKEIIEMYPHQLYNTDMKFGGTPLHWAKTRQVLEALLGLGCHINARNFEGNTALHIMIARDRLPCVITLLSHGAEVNSVNTEGNMPIHLAAKSENVIIVQALLVFGAQLNSINGAGETARHIAARSKKKELLFILHAVGAKQCEKKLPSCQDGCELGGHYNGIPPQKDVTLRTRHIFDDMLAAAAMNAAVSQKLKKVVMDSDQVDSSTREGRILCLDGGGVRGLVLIQMLIMMEEYLQVPIVHCFDWIAGTSTGGILALALASGKTVYEIQSMYLRFKDKVFSGSRPYGAEPLETFLQKEFGDKTTMSDIKNPKVMVTGVLADRYPVDLHLFRNYQSPEDILGVEHEQSFTQPPKPEEQLLWSAARSSGAAPTYFRASGRFLDGGLVANNPTLDLLTEIYEYNMALKATGREDLVESPTVVVSLGTGKPPVEKVNAVDIFRPGNITDTIRLVCEVSTMGKMLIDQVSATDGRVVDRARAWCNMIGVPYFRFSPQLSEDISLDETSDKILVNMLWETKAYMHSKRQELHQLATLLRSPEL